MRNFKLGAGEAAMRFNGDDESTAITYNGTESYSLTAGGIRLRNVATASLPSDPPDGTTVYDTTSQSLKTYNGTSWIDGGTGASYETGTWTPNLCDGSYNTSEGQTYSIQDGRYTRIGNMIHYEGRIYITSLGTLTAGSGSVIGPLPYPNGTGSSFIGGGSVVSIANNAATFEGPPFLAVDANNDSWLALRKWVTNADTSVAISEINANAYLKFHGFYWVS